MTIRQTKYTRELLEPVVKSAVSMSDIMRKLGLKVTGGNYRHIKMRLRAAGIDLSHFKGVLWSKGLNINHPAITAGAAKRSIPDSEVFKRGSTYTTSALKRRLIKLGVEYKCVECGLKDWRNKSIRLHVDHVDGDTTNNLLSNLRFLCPNCHQQTETWGYKGSGRVYQSPKLKKCLKCDKPCRNLYCSYQCARIAQQKIDWPANLEELVNQSSCLAVAKTLGVSDKAVKNRLTRCAAHVA